MQVLNIKQQFFKCMKILKFIEKLEVCLLLIIIIIKKEMEIAFTDQQDFIILKILLNLIKQDFPLKLLI